MPPLVGRDAAEGVGARRVLLDRGQRVVQDDRVAFELQVLEACRQVDGRHAAHRTREGVRAATTEAVTGLPTPPRGAAGARRPRLAV
jgi:hypothetical protein